jgi:hypothetical protein
MLKERAVGLELAQEDPNNASNNVHADNVWLVCEVALFKARKYSMISPSVSVFAVLLALFSSYT